MTREVSVDENPGRGLSYALITTAIGRIGIAWSDRGVVRLQLPESDDATTVASLIRGGEMVASPLSARMVLLADALECYGRGERRDFSATPLDLSGLPDFHRTIYAATLRLSWGETATYGQLADRVGAAGAARAVGQAMARNPIPVIIPCHRVLASGQRMGGFSAPGGGITKARLLALEGVHLGGTPSLPGLFSD